MAVLCTFREPSLCRHVHRELMRNAVLDVTPIILTIACHQRNYVERYSRSIRHTLMLWADPHGFPRVRRLCGMQLHGARDVHHVPGSRMADHVEKILTHLILPP